jgi:hypothetical protein
MSPTPEQPRRPEHQAAFNHANELLSALETPAVRSPTAPEAAPADTKPSLEAELRQTLAERHPDWPPIKLNMYLSSHGSDEDIRGLADHMPKADIYLFEMAGYSDKARRQFQAEANQEPSWLDRRRRNAPAVNTFEGKQREIIRNSGVVVDNIDLQPHEKAVVQSIMISLNTLFKVRDDHNFDTYLDGIKANFARAVELQEAREHLMVERFESKLEQIFTAHPELKQQPHVEVLASMGSYHTPLFHKFREAGVTTERNFPEKPHIYSYKTQVMRTFAFDREPTREMLAKAYIESVWKGTTGRRIPNQSHLRYDDWEYYGRQVGDAFSESEIEGIFQCIQHGDGLKLAEFDEMLQAKGLPPVPDNVSQLHEQAAAMKAKAFKARQTGHELELAA